MLTSDDQEKLSITAPFFKGAENGFQIVLEKHGSARDDHVSRLLWEASSRFKQLHVLHNRVTVGIDDYFAFQRQFASQHRGGLVVDPVAVDCLKQMYATGDVLELDTECFYIFSFRIIEITRSVNDKLFGQERILPEPAGVRDARNKLILHPEQVKQNPILSRSMTVRVEGDVQLKTSRRDYESSDFLDKGFIANAEEFRVFLIAWASKAYARIASPPTGSGGVVS